MRRAGRGTLYALYSLDDIAELWICAGLICTYVELEDKKRGNDGPYLRSRVLIRRSGTSGNLRLQIMCKLLPEPLPVATLTSWVARRLWRTANSSS